MGERTRECFMVISDNTPFDHGRNPIQTYLWGKRHDLCRNWRAKPEDYLQHMNSESMREDIDLSNKAREMVHIREKALKHMVAKGIIPQWSLISLRKGT